MSYGVQCNFSDNVPELQLAASGALHIIEPICRAPQIARLSSRTCRETALLAKFKNTVAMTISFGERLALFQSQALVLSDAVSGVDDSMQPGKLVADQITLF
jgi:hypothetical protein